MKRRTFLARTGQLAVLGGSGAALKSERIPAFLASREEETLGAVLDILLPSAPDSPGAREVKAKEHILSIISDPEIEPSEREFIRKGIRWIDEFAREKEQQRFDALTPAKRQDVFQAFSEQERGENWLSTLVTYTLEALFGDPAYGINVDGAGWKWIDHHPGFPHPPGRKWYKKI